MVEPSCYGVPTTSIEALFEKVESFPRQGMFNTDERTRSTFASQQNENTREILKAFVPAFVTFFRITKAIADERLKLLSVNDSSYVRTLDTVFTRALETAGRLLQLMIDQLANDSMARADLVLEMIASETVAEMTLFARGVSAPATNAPEALEHGQAAKEIADSVKKFLKGALTRVIPGKLRRAIEGTIDNVLHAMNEILKMALGVAAT